MPNSKIALITGANRGIGFEILKSFINDGYIVIGTSRSQSGVDIINKSIKFSKVLIYRNIDNFYTFLYYL